MKNDTTLLDLGFTRRQSRKKNKSRKKTSKKPPAGPPTITTVDKLKHEL